MGKDKGGREEEEISTNGAPMVAKGGGCGDAGGGYSERRGEAEMRTHDKEGRTGGGAGGGAALSASTMPRSPEGNQPPTATRVQQDTKEISAGAASRGGEACTRCDGVVGSRMWHTLRRTGSAPSAEEAAKEAQQRARPLANGCSCSWRWRGATAAAAAAVAGCSYCSVAVS